MVEIMKPDALTFTVSDKEYRLFIKWNKARTKVIGYDPHYKWSFTPTGIGCLVEVTDTISNETFNVTDYDSW